MNPPRRDQSAPGLGRSARPAASPKTSTATGLVPPKGLEDLSRAAEFPVPARVPFILIAPERPLLYFGRPKDQQNRRPAFRDLLRHASNRGGRYAPIWASSSIRVIGGGSENVRFNG